ncbi:MAG: phosphoribosylanthranilate isomerase [Gammaproteobacteria bacterium]|nr:phosphoribosylanthranilate isomerase [Gammaproteobacteria bacterium]
MTMTKLCGFRTQETVRHAVELQCDFIGLNFVPTSPRFVTLENAAAIVRQNRNETAFVGVFMDQAEEDIRSTLQRVKLDYLQFHGNETASFCDGFDKPYIRALNVSESFDFPTIAEQYPNAYAFLLDAAGKGGGSGETFNWHRFPKATSKRVILAGGLRPDNVGEAIRTTNPWGVDVASGIENTNHTKNLALMTQFMQEVRRVSA